MNVPEVYLGDTSLIIATYNEEESLSFVLEEIQNYNLGEIIIVDGNSTDQTEHIANKYNTKFFTQSKRGWGNAVREAINEAFVSILHIWMAMVLTIQMQLLR